MRKPKDYDEYLATAPEGSRETLDKLRAVIQSVVPGDATETISYGMPAFFYKRGLVCIGAFKNHCSLFPMNAGLVATYREELKGFATSRGTIQFQLDKPLPVALIKKLVKARVAENKLGPKR